MATGTGYYVGGDDWYAYVNISLSSETETTGTFLVKAWMYVGPSGDSDFASNIKGWAGIWDSANGYRWSSSVNLGNFDPGDGWITSSNTPFKSQSWTVTKTHSSQKVYGYSDIIAEAGYYSGSESKASAYVTLAAQTSYTVKYNANNGSGAPSNDTKWYGETLKLSTTTPTRTGYTFAGWNTKSDGTGTNYAAGANYTANAAVTLYAKWTANTYTISYNANNGSGTMSNQTKTYGTDLTLRANTFTRTGYNFKNYNTAANGSGTSYSSGGKYTANTAATMYAQWTIQTYTISYNANGGTGAPASQTKTYNVALTLSSTKPTRTGYNFLGWGTSSSATTATYQPSASYTGNADATLYAVWQVAAPSLTITKSYRADSTGAAADEGTYARVEANWSVKVASTLSWSCVCNSVTETTTFDSTTAQDNLSGTVVFLVNAAMLTDQSYTVSLTLTDDYGTTTKTDTITTAFFTIDVRAGGHGIAFGKPATTDNLADFAMPITTNGDITISHGASGTGSLFKATRTDTNKGVWFGVGTDGSNRGIWDKSQSKWIIYVNSSNNTVINGLTAVSVPDLAADKITSGTFAAARIPSLAASKIGSGTLGIDRLPTVTRAKGGTGVTEKQTSTVTTNTDNVSEATTYCWHNGVVATVTMRGMKLKAQLASGSSKTIGTIPSGYRPASYAYAAVHTTTVANSWGLFVAINSSGSIVLYNEASVALPTTANLYFTITYCI